jgi:CheY-like chemotaxis protein
MGTSQSHVVMVVEDDPDTRDALCEALTLYGYDAVSAPNGEQALRLLRASARPCLILLDMMMPVMDGWEFRTLQRTDEQIAMIPVACLTADRTARDRASDAGFIAFLPKPVELEEILSLIREHC